MENILEQAFESGNATAVVAALIVYLIIHIQRRNTSQDRETELKTLNKEISELKKDNELKQKDIDYLLAENDGIKADIKEMKTTLQQMAISLAKIAAKYDEN